MSAVVEDHAPVAESHDDAHHAEHPSDRKYIGIALLLAAITAVEIGLYYLEDQLGALVAPTLILLSMSKFFIVVFFFMHMKFEKPIIRRIFFVCFGMAIIVYVLYLLTFGALFGLRPYEYVR